MEPTLIIIDGLMGSGKSTQAKYLAENYSALNPLFIPEFALYNPLLGKESEQVTMNQSTLIGEYTLLDMFLSKKEHNLIIKDTSFLMTQNAFMGPSTAKKASTWLLPYEEFLLKHDDYKVYHIILDITFQVMLERIKLRNRDFEQLINPQYYEQLHTNWSNFLDKTLNEFIFINANQSLEAVQKEIIRKIIQCL